MTMTCQQQNNNMLQPKGSGKTMNNHGYFFYCRIAAFDPCLINVCCVLHRCHMVDVSAAHQDKCQVLGLENLPTEKEESKTRITLSLSEQNVSYCCFNEDIFI